MPEPEPAGFDFSDLDRHRESLAWPVLGVSRGHLAFEPVHQPAGEFDAEGFRRIASRPAIAIEYQSSGIAVEFQEPRYRVVIRHSVLPCALALLIQSAPRHTRGASGSGDSEKLASSGDYCGVVAEFDG